MNIEKFKNMFCVQVKFFNSDVHKWSNEAGETDYIMSKNCDYLNFDFITNDLNTIFNQIQEELKKNCIDNNYFDNCDGLNNYTTFTILEDIDGNQDNENGDFIVDYDFSIFVNGIELDGTELQELLNSYEAMEV